MIKRGLSFITGFKYSACKSNHKGRYCQEITQNDISLDMQGKIRKPGAGDVTTVVLGEKLDIVVHNNGCLPYTWVYFRRKDINGVLSGPNFSGEQIQHSDPSGLSPPDESKYTADRTISYQTPYCLAPFPTGRDELQFRTDGTNIFTPIELKKTNLYRFIDSNSNAVFSADLGGVRGFHIASKDMYCDTLHVHGNNPCNGAPDPAAMGCGQGKVEAYDPTK